LLGTTKLRNAVLGMSIARVWNRVKMPADWSMARFNMHSAAVAVLSDLLAQRVPVEYPEGAFVAGLLHDAGRLLIALALPEEHDRIVEMYAAGGCTLTACERQVLGFGHPELSAEAIEFWKLPEPIQLAVRDHHHPPRGFALSRVIDAANQYINSTGESILIRNTDSADPAVIESLGLNTSELQTLLVEFRAENEAMASYFR
jgi:HD-like signal output (HDOD) protein